MTDETLVRARALALVERIKAWREDDKAGYDQAIELVCEAEPVLIAAIEQPLQQQIATLDLRRRHLETVNSEIAEAQEAAEDALRRTEQELADAAHEINCAGPIAHRIRVFKQEVDMALRESRARVEQLEQALKDVDRANSHQGAGPHCTCSQRERERIISAALASLAEATADGQKGK
jgi:chromosome segregation ATPase